MCRMVGASSGLPGSVVAEPFLRMARGENARNEKNKTLGLVAHGDGWGAVLAQGNDIWRVRRAGACWSDTAYDQVRAADVRLLHARLASRGAVSEANSHPFSERIRGEDWFFCHNGTLYDEPNSTTGNTDSERFFRRMVPLLARGDDPVTAFEAAASTLSRITALNAFLLSPEGLWAFCVWADGRFPTYYTLSWAETEYGVVVASEPLHALSETWTPMENGTAIAVPARRSNEHPAVRIARLRLPSALIPAERSVQ